MLWLQIHILWFVWSIFSYLYINWLSIAWNCWFTKYFYIKLYCVFEMYGGLFQLWFKLIKFMVFMHNLIAIHDLKIVWAEQTYSILFYRHRLQLNIYESYWLCIECPWMKSECWWKALLPHMMDYLYGRAIPIYLNHLRFWMSYSICIESW